LFAGKDRGVRPHRKDKMLIVDDNLAIDFARLYKGTVDEPDEDGTEIVVTMSIDEEDTLLIEWTNHPSKTQLYIPLDRLKKILKGR
jgi:hypothetical protein